jgi:serine/threonine-protein kinase
MTAGPDLHASGQKLGRYELVRRLAVGGMAEIYLARLPGVGLEGFEKLVVLKRILPQHALDPELLRMFTDEARLSATLTNPHVTEVYDVGADAEAPFFAMEYVHGQNLRQLLHAHGGPLPIPHAVGIVAAAAAGLHYAHEKRGPGGEPMHIVHRDVSPSNVLVSYDGAVKVSDFGIAKWAHQRTQTQEGALKGKFAYMSPEQCRGRALDARSDVFALGTILYELTTGRSPFAAETDFDILNKIVSGEPEPPRLPDGAEYPPALAEIVMRALAREPEARTPNAQALQVQLEAFARDGRLEVSTVALASFVQGLFADELAAWREAQRAGKSLADHLAEREAARPREGGVAPRTATDAFAATRRVAPAKRRRLATAAALAVLTVTGGLIAASNHKRTAAEVPVAHAPAPEPARVVSTPAPAEHNVESQPAPTTPVVPTNVAQTSVRGPDKSASRRGSRARAARPATAAVPSTESRLHAWDPDSPVPP